jgi:hypothetical protein
LGQFSAYLVKMPYHYLDYVYAKPETITGSLTEYWKLVPGKLHNVSLDCASKHRPRITIQKKKKPEEEIIISYSSRGKATCMLPYLDMLGKDGRYIEALTIWGNTPIYDKGKKLNDSKPDGEYFEHLLKHCPHLNQLYLRNFGLINYKTNQFINASTKQLVLSHDSVSEGMLQQL